MSRRWGEDLQLVECVGDLKDENVGEAVVLHISMGWFGSGEVECWMMVLCEEGRVEGWNEEWC